MALYKTVVEPYCFTTNMITHRLCQLLVFFSAGMTLFACSTFPGRGPTADIREVQTSVFLTIQAEITQSVGPTLPQSISTAAATSTEVLQQDYPQSVVIRFRELQSAFVELSNMHSQFTANPTLSQDTEWYGRAVSALVKVTNGAAELAHLRNYPPEYAEFHQEMQTIAQQGNVLFSTYMIALDNQDLAAQQQATQQLGEMITSLNRAFDELNRLVTPAP